MAPRAPVRLRVLLMTALLVGGLALVAAPAPAAAQTEAPVKLMVLGETHGTKSMTRDLVEIARAKGASGCVCPGDFTYGDWDTSPGEWRDMIAGLRSPMLPAQGNHDWPWSDWKSLFPGEQPYYAQVVNGVQFVSLNPEHASLAPGSTQREWLERTLASREPDTLKVVLLHRPWWLPSGAVHPASEFESRAKTSASAMDALMVKHGVDLVVSAHEKNYQHSVRSGVHYLVAGGGGPNFYSMGYSLPGAVKRLASNVVTTVDVTPASLTLKSYDRSWSKVEEWTLRGSAGGGSSDGAGGGGLSATYRPHDGSEWWVQTRVDASAPLAKVEARVDGGAWKSLTHRSWGSWAASIHAPDGARVEFRATSTTGATDTSGAYAWPSGTPLSSGGTGGGFSATFSPYDGNAWWVQTKVDASAALSKVEARVDGGAWKPLTHRSWGAWAASIHAPEGSRVEFRATSTAGATATSGAYAWPSGAPAASFSATFRPHDGNEWWVQAKVDASSPLAKVEARVDGGAWKPLTHRSWGSWAASIHAPDGARVEFRATSTAGATDTSGAYVWPVG